MGDELSPPDLLIRPPRNELLGPDTLSLESLAGYPYARGALVFVNENKSYYGWDSTSAALHIPPDVIEPRVTVGGRGRWLFLAALAPNAGSGVLAPADTISVAAVRRLVDIDTTDLADGSVIWVNSVESFFSFDETSALAADGITVIDPTVGPGRWLRVENPSLRWQKQTAWFMNAVSGNDEFDGSSAASLGGVVGPIRTPAELVRRINRGIITANTTVDLAAGTYGDFSPLTITLAGATFTVRGALTIAATGTLSAVTATNPAAGTRGLETNTLGDPAFVDETRLRLTSGPNAGALSWVTSVPAANQANDSRWGLVDPALSVTPTVVAPAIGNTYAVETYDTTIGRLDIIVRGTGRFIVRDVNISASASTWHTVTNDQSSEGGFVFYACRFITNAARFRDSNAYFISCHIDVTSTFVLGAYFLSMNCVTDLMGTNSAAGMSFLQSNCFDGGQILVQSQASFQASGDTQFVDQTSISVTAQAPGAITSDTHPLWGANNAMPAAFQMRNGGRYDYTAGTPPTIPGGVVDTIIGGTSTAYGALPFFNATGVGGGAAIVERS